MLLFFKMGFLLLINEFDLDNLALVELVDVWCKLEVPVCNGP